MVRSRSWHTGDRPEVVPAGHVWVEGDNPDNSSDSRAYGPIPLAMVQARVFYKVRAETHRADHDGDHLTDQDVDHQDLHLPL